MLPDKFRTYFDHQCQAALADRLHAMDAAARQLKDRAIRAGGLGSRYFVGLQDLYSREASERGAVIVGALKTAATAFAADLAPVHDEEIIQLVGGVFTSQVEALRGSYRRKAGQYIDRLPEQLDGLRDIQVAAASAGFANTVRRYLWELHNLPKPSTIMSSSNTVNVSGNVYGAVQAGPGSSASVRQSMIMGENAENLIASLERLVNELRNANIDAESLAVVASQAASAEQELRSAAPSRIRLLSYLGGIGAIVQTLGSSADAWVAVKALANACGIPLP